MDRTLQHIELAETRTFTNNDVSFKLDFYRNNAYQCGLSGNYTFLVVNPRGDPDASAPLWVYLHGGGNGYWDEDGVYHSTLGQTEDSYNHEEDSAKLLWHLRVRMQAADGQTEDQTLKRRIDEGYRLLIVSYCDHDLYSGLGTPYPNHPTNPDAQVNGLQATMAAVDFTSAIYPTTQIWAHGTSAGSAGAWALASSYAAEGNPLTGIIADSGIFTPKQSEFQSLIEQGEGLREETWETAGITEKIGFYADLNIPAYPEGQIAYQDFRSIPSLFIAGDADPFCFGHLEAIPEARAAGLSNCAYTYSALSQAIANQVDSPHEFHLLPGAGHVPTNDPGPANDIVDAFIQKTLAAHSGLEPEAVLGASRECPWDESDPTLRAFIVAGQSGMVSPYGVAGTLPSHYEAGIDQLLMWDAGSWKRLGLSTENGSNLPRYGPELSFAWTIHAACPDSRIGFIKYAVGGSSITTWVPEGENSSVLVQNIEAAVEAHPDITFEGFLFKQGAADMFDRQLAESWGEKYLEIVNFTRSLSFIPRDLLFIHASPRVGEFSDDLSDLDPDSISLPEGSRPFIVHVAKEQWEVQFDLSDIYVTIMRDIPVGEDGLHATPDGIRTEGRNFAETFLGIGQDP